MKFIPPILNVISLVGVALTSVWIGIWLALRFSGATSQPAHTASIAPLREMWLSLTDFATPVPYFAVSCAGTMFFSVEGLLNRYRYGENSALKMKFRQETQEHGTTKRSYYDSLSDALKFLLTPASINFTDSCRVSIYRQERSGAERLKKIFRYSANAEFSENGRFSIPNDEGVVGAAWRGAGQAEFRSGPNRTMERYLVGCGVGVPATELSMPSRVYWAKRIDDHDSGQRVGVIVYESTIDNCLDFEKIAALVSLEKATLERFVKHLAKLDTQFNPDGEGGNG